MPHFHHAAVTRHPQAWMVEALAEVPGEPREAPNGWVRRLAAGVGDAALGTTVVDALNASADPGLELPEGPPPAAQELGLSSDTELAVPGARRIRVEYARDLLLLPMATVLGEGFVPDAEVPAAEILESDGIEVLGAAVRALLDACREQSEPPPV